MCLTIPNKNLQNSDEDFEAVDTNWQEIYQIYLLKIEIETTRTLKMIRDDIKRKGLTFNRKLKDSLLRFTNAR